ncbi:hypothetical protein L6R52_36880 [Myxococcota bacterium]|nr:hypothetical protein [Myxococcota bacterium]
MTTKKTNETKATDVKVRASEGAAGAREASCPCGAECSCGPSCACANSCGCAPKCGCSSCGC